MSATHLVPTEKNFGIVFTVVFTLIALYPLLDGGDVRWWGLGIAAVLLAMTLVRPALLKIPNLLWAKFGLALGAVMAPVAMAIVYALAIVPAGLIARVLGKDLLHRKFEKEANTYWIARHDPPGPMRNRF